MNEIKLSVNDENMEVVLSILNNLKDGLIKNIDTTRAKTAYNPKTKVIIKEEESATSDRNGKYINPAIYKQRLNKK
ncbi:MAG: hypothetical protein GQ570_03380 [Helicobacteraceae bacterium]|nr:hypothetical protein [Helicobacteraceae bacterium]